MGNNTPTNIFKIQWTIPEFHWSIPRILENFSLIKSATPVATVPKPKIPIFKRFMR